MANFMKFGTKLYVPDPGTVHFFSRIYEDKYGHLMLVGVTILENDFDIAIN